MTDDRADILNRLAAGQISADEAARLLREPAEAPQPVNAPSLASRWLRVRVTDLTTGRQRVNVNLPLSWVQIGMKIGARHSPEIAGIDFADLLSKSRRARTARSSRWRIWKTANGLKSLWIEWAEEGGRSKKGDNAV